MLVIIDIFDKKYRQCDQNRVDYILRRFNKTKQNKNEQKIRDTILWSLGNQAGEIRKTKNST